MAVNTNELIAELMKKQNELNKRLNAMQDRQNAMQDRQDESLEANLKLSAELDKEKELRETSEKLRLEAEILNNEAKQKLKQDQKDDYVRHINTLDKSGASLLHLACMANDIPTINKLVREGADINIKNQGGYTPLDTARLLGRAPLILVLKAHGGIGPNTTLVESIEAPDIHFSWKEQRKFSPASRKIGTDWFQSLKNDVAQLLKL